MRIRITESNLMPPGEYLAEVAEITDDNGIYGRQFRWLFVLVKPEKYAGQTLVAWTSTSANLKSRFVKWAAACIGRDCAAGEELTTEGLVGQQVILVVVVRSNKDGEFNKVEDLKQHDHSLPRTDGETFLVDPFDDED